MARIANLLEIKKYFEIATAEFSEMWKKLSDQEKEFFKTKVGKVLEEKGE